MRHRPRARALAVLAAVAALFVTVAPSESRAQSDPFGYDLTILGGVRRLPAASGLESALRAAGYGELRTFVGGGYTIGLSFNRWRGEFGGMLAWGGAQSAGGRIGAQLTDVHFDVGYDVVVDRELLVSVLGGLGGSELDVDARAPGWTLFANQLGGQDDAKRVTNQNVNGSLQVAIEGLVPYSVVERAGLTLGLRGGWLVPLGTFGWQTDEDKNPHSLHGPPTDLGGEWLTVTVGLGGWTLPPAGP
jgi:hypothetical protein